MDVTHQHLVFEGHAVLAYDQEAALSSTVPAVLASAGFCGGIVLVATDQHRSAVLDGLAQLTDLDALESAQRIVVLEASEALDRIMVHGQPDPERFASVIGSPIRALAATGPVIAFGEMVALLWDAGEIGAVLELEDLWNGIGSSVPLDLVCGYSGPSLATGPRREVSCRHHHHLHRAAFRSLPCEPESVAAARHFATSTLIAWDLADLVPDGQIVVSELAANSVTHARSPLHLSLQERGHTVRVIVADESSAAPMMRAADVHSTGGRGLHLVEASSTAWGHRAIGGAKRVWVDLQVAAVS